MFTESLPRRAVRRAVATIDALAAPHGIDRYIEQVIPTWSTTEIRGRIVDVDRSSAGSVVLTIEPNGGWTQFRPGQYTQLTVEVDGVSHTRCYSMASSAGTSRRFQLGIKAHPEGLVSQHLVAHAKVGMIVGLSSPAGDFHLPDTRPDRVLLVSGGSGITPVMSMLRTLCIEGHTGPVTFVHYARSPEAMLFADEIATIESLHPNVTVATAFDDDSGTLRGLFSVDHLDVVDADWRTAEAFVCGPPPLMAAVQDAYESADAAERFHQEAFTLPQFIGEAGTVGGSLRFGVTDQVVDNDGRPLLDQAEAAGLSPQSGCRMGICHTCTRSLTCGTVRNVVTGEVTSGSNVDIRICINAPVGDVEIDL